jgi:hypothetical protein
MIKNLSNQIGKEPKIKIFFAKVNNVVELFSPNILFLTLLPFIPPLHFMERGKGGEVPKFLATPIILT